MEVKVGINTQKYVDWNIYCIKSMMMSDVS